MLTSIEKRDGRTVQFDLKKITDAIFKAAQAIGGNDYEAAQELAKKVRDHLEKESQATPTVEHVQDVVEKVLIENGMPVRRRNLFFTVRNAQECAK